MQTQRTWSVFKWLIKNEQFYIIQWKLCLRNYCFGYRFTSSRNNKERMLLYKYPSSFQATTKLRHSNCMCYKIMVRTCKKCILKSEYCVRNRKIHVKRRMNRGKKIKFSRSLRLRSQVTRLSYSNSLVKEA